MPSKLITYRTPRICELGLIGGKWVYEYETKCPHCDSHTRIDEITDTELQCNTCDKIWENQNDHR